MMNYMRYAKKHMAFYRNSEFLILNLNAVGRPAAFFIAKISSVNR